MLPDLCNARHRNGGEDRTLARFFKYKTPEALSEDARNRGLEIRIQNDFEPLTRPVQVGNRIVGNRLAIQPMEGCDGDLDGRAGPLTLRRYQRFGSGGAKLIWVEACAVVPEGRANPRQLMISPAHVESLRAILDTIRQAHRQAFGRDDDLLVGLQLTHSGRYSYKKPILAQHHPLLDARTYLDKAAGRLVRPSDPLISDEELDRLQLHYATAALLAYRIGFDFVDLKQCHGYLLNELLGARGRPGKYGGTFFNRTRFIRDVVMRIRREKPDALIATRLNLSDGLPYRHGGPDDQGIPEDYQSPYLCAWGVDESNPLKMDFDEPLELIAQLRELGVGLVNVTLGNPYANPHWGRPFEFPPTDGYESPEHPLEGVARHLVAAATVQRAFPDLAVVGTGYSWLQEFAFHVGAAQVAAGDVTFMGYGRGALAQPDFAARILAGKPLERKRICRTFSYCTGLMRSKNNQYGQLPSGCPPFDKEVYGPIWDQAEFNPDRDHRTERPATVAAP